MSALPPFVYSLAFWKAISYIAAGIVALLVQAGVLDAKYLYDSAAILAAILAVLSFLQIHPELRAKGRA